MATIESLDLATLTNNPQSIAQALEDVLVTSNANIASLKNQIDADALTIANLKTQVEADALTIENLVGANAFTFYTGTNVMTYENSFYEMNTGSSHAITYAYKFQNVVHINFVASTSTHTGYQSNLKFGELVTELRPIRDIVLAGSIGFDWSDQNDAGINCFIETSGRMAVGNFSNQGHASTMFGCNGFYYLD